MRITISKKLRERCLHFIYCYYLDLCVCVNELIRLLKTCEQRSESVFLYKITKQIAEKDSITEGHSYILSYDYERFLREWGDIVDGKNFDENYLEQVGLPIYGMFLKQYLF